MLCSDTIYIEDILLISVSTGVERKHLRGMCCIKEKMIRKMKEKMRLNIEFKATSVTNSDELVIDK